MFKGVMTALATPFSETGLDEQALRKMVERQIEAGIHGLVVCGTTGEAASMSVDEQLQASEIVLDQAAGRVPVIAGSGSNSTSSSVEMTKRVAQIGVAAALVVTPYYVKPTQAGLLEHYGQVAEVGLPIVAYNVPSRTGVSITPETAVSLAKMDKVVALKEASANMLLDAQIVQAVEQAAGAELVLLSGDDFTFLPFLALGGQGAISVVSNVAPAEMSKLYQSFETGDLSKARSLHYRLLPLMQKMFLQSNPIPVKAALAMMGLYSWDIRSPLTQLAEQLKPELERELDLLGLMGDAS